MADFSSIIQEVNTDINTNGANEITGAKLNQVLRDMIAAVNAAKTDILPDGSLFGGFAYPNEDTPYYGDDHRYFYIAFQQGNYPAFNIDLDGNILTLMYWFEDGPYWLTAMLAPTPVGLDVRLSGYMESQYLYISLGFPQFSPYTDLPYNVGDVVVYEGILYKFKNQHIGAWDEDDVIEYSLKQYIDDK